MMGSQLNSLLFQEEGCQNGDLNMEFLHEEPVKCMHIEKQLVPNKLLKKPEIRSIAMELHPWLLSLGVGKCATVAN